ncbi:glycogen synthase GlgA [candidate division KSB1 bacterium]|nr:glycogen synthase GlgA [candidate division KSB1 bacterium]
MKNRLRILFLSSEVAPFAKTGGLGDVSSALPKALYEMGHDIRVMMPKYGTISERKYVLREVIRLKKIPVKMGGAEHATCAKSAFIPDSKVQVYFLDYKPFFERPGLYIDPKTGQDFPDNAERFLLFCRAVFETVRLLHWEPQVIHCNDWQTALIPWLLKYELKTDGFFQKTTTLLSIHNMAYQGAFEQASVSNLGLPVDIFNKNNDMEAYGKTNFLKAGILNADMLTTVSPRYAQEIQNDPKMGAGLENVLKKRSKDLYGILNGVDYSIWDPGVDDLIENKYDVSDVTGKKENKKTLSEKCGFTFDESIPIVGIVSRLVEQKGFDLVISALPQMISMGMQIVILGMGDEKYHEGFTKLAKKYPKNLAVFLKFDETLAHLIEAGSDMFLMPSLFEPCGLNQMYSLRYGTVPIVRNVGGLADTIIDYDTDTGKGNGFVFTDSDDRTLLETFKRAMEVYRDQGSWLKLLKRGMKADFSWKSTAEKFVKLYSKLEKKK